MAHGVEPVIYYFNPNIYPLEEYEIRKNESKRHAESLGIQWIDADRIASGGEQPCGWKEAHNAWRQEICGMENEPERGKRCAICFYHRLLATARKAQELGIPYFATTLASSRWKNLEQINAAGEKAAKRVQTPSGRPSTDRVQTDSPRFWAQNWRKDGLQDRRNELLKEYAFYNQTYCGCEYSMRNEGVKE